MNPRSLLLATTVIACGVLAPFAARADIRPNNKKLRPDQPTVPLTVKTDDSTEVSILRIGRDALKQAGMPVPGKRAELSPRDFRHIVAAVALSLGIAGVFLLRRKRGIAATVGLVAGAIVATAAMQAFGDIPPPPGRWRGVDDFRGPVAIEIVDEPAGQTELILGTRPPRERAPEPHRPSAEASKS